MVEIVVLKVICTLNKRLPQVPMNLSEVVRRALDFGKHDHPSLLGRILLHMPLNCRLPLTPTMPFKFLWIAHTLVRKA